MGNSTSSSASSSGGSPPKSFPANLVMDGAAFLCGSTEDITDDTTAGQSTTQQSTLNDESMAGSLLAKADAMCISSPKEAEATSPTTTMEEPSMNPTSALFARALVSEVTDNPRTMTPAAMAEREKRLLKAQEAARKPGAKPVGTMGQPNLVASLKHALGANGTGPATASSREPSASVVPPNSLSENRAQQTPPRTQAGQHSVTIGLSLSRRHSTLGHPDTVTRQTAFDFNELQDRQYKYVSSTDSSGWLAGGGERGGAGVAHSQEEHSVNSMLGTNHHKVAAPDVVHIPIIQIDADSPAAVNAIVSALARGEVFIPHMSILPEALSVNGISPPDLIVRFGCERNDDVPPEEWPNWCLEFMHNQLYEYFMGSGARWSVRPFQITLARKVRWKTVKHMNRYFAHAERVIDAWREKGPQYCDPQLSYIEGGATPEEVARPHGIYLLRNGVPTNYFAPNFDPPYTTKMTRSLIQNVLAKSWDKKRREWTSEPVPRLVTPTTLVATMCGCADGGQGGFMANEATNKTVNGKAAPPATVQNDVIPAVDSVAEKDKVMNQAIFETSSQEESTTNIQNSASGGSTKMSSVHLTPYNAQEMAALQEKLETADPFGGLLGETTSSSSQEEPPAPMESPPRLRKSSDEDLDWKPQLQKSSEEDLDWNVPKEDISSQKNFRTRYGHSPTPERLSFRSRGSSAGSSPGTSPTENAAASAPSEFAPSTTTTVLHMNGNILKPVLNQEQPREKVKLDPEGVKQDPEGIKREEVSADDEEEEASEISTNEWIDSAVIPKSTSSGSRKKKKSRNKVKEAYEKERARQIAMIALAQEETNKVHSSSSRSQQPTESTRSSPKYSMSSNDVNSKAQNIVQRNDSGSVSLDYSLDSSLLGDQSTLAGQYIGGDASVSTSASKRKTSRTEEDSIMEETAPSDEALFAVGWAKALDPKSGSYYYFTLDRSKIVWENPLEDADNNVAHAEASSKIQAKEAAMT